MLAVLWLGLTASLQAPDAGVRPAKTADLVGTWQAAAVHAPPGYEDRDLFFAPHQALYFDRGGRSKLLTSARPLDAKQWAAFDAMPLATRYTVDAQGILTETNPAWPRPRRALCTLVLGGGGGDDPRLARRGDLLLTGMDSGGRMVWSKLLRRIERK